MNAKQEEQPPAAKRIKMEGWETDPRAAMEMCRREKMNAARHQSALSSGAVAVKQDGKSESEALGKKKEKDQWHFRFNCPVSDDSTTSFCENCLCYPCNVPACQCQEWIPSHCNARDDSPHWIVQHEDICEIQKWLNNPVIDLFDTTEIHAPMHSQERCRNSPFYYPNKATFDKALGIYNMQSTRKTHIGALYTIPKQRRTFKREQVRGRHKKPCDDCGRHFRKYTHYFVSEFGKYCLGCMGRVVAVHVSPDPSQLNHLKQQEEERIELINKECANDYKEMVRKQEERVRNDPHLFGKI